MNQAFFRRIALSVASISFGIFMAVILLCSICRENPLFCYAEGSKAVQHEFTESIQISCTPMIVENLAYYDGAFYEDGSGRDVMDVAALVLYNDSDDVIPFASIVVYTESCRYEFEATMLPPCSRILIPEKNGMILTEKSILRCFGWMTVCKNTMSKEIEVVGSDAITVYNHTGQTVDKLVIYHRMYLPEDDIYIGGRAFAFEISGIDSGEEISCLPPHYTPRYSRVIWFE